MTWKINFTKSADKDFSKLSKNIQSRIVLYIKEKVLESPRDHGKSLVSSQKIKLWRYRVENYRLICQINDQDITILIVKIGKRDSVYKDRR